MNDFITENLRGFEIKLKLKPGVFSPRSVDSGSKLFIDHLKVADGTVIADVGCGSGVIGIVAAKLNPSGHVQLLDDHLRSTELARENVELNRLKNAEVYLSDVFSAVGERTYHQIISNPPQHLSNDFLDFLAGEFNKHLKPGGEIWWVVQKHLKPFIKRLFDNHFGNCTIVAHGQEHVVLKAKRE